MTTNERNGIDIKIEKELLLSINPENAYSSTPIIIIPCDSKIKIIKEVPMTTVVVEPEII
jgi:hypothetical protein